MVRRKSEACFASERSRNDAQLHGHPQRRGRCLRVVKIPPRAWTPNLYIAVAKPRKTEVPK